MELKSYQKRVIDDLTDYVSVLVETGSLCESFSQFWAQRGVTVGVAGIRHYQDVIPGVPHVCYKVPTGGGKTLLACASVKPVLDAMAPTGHRALVWLVPSDAILTQTLQALKNPDHPYRQRLNVDFNNRVEVYSKEELLAGQNFNPTTVSEQLTVMVLSYDSFRTSKAEGRKAYQANGALASFPKFLGTPDRPIAEADETALFQVINQLNPMVVVDESHHARSTLSLEMLTNFNPSFVLDLTATPTKQANIIAYVDALELKNEHMVKLPVIVYNRDNQTSVIADAIDLRTSLEAAASREHQNGGEYIRPIVLFQAQPKTSEDATSFEKLRAKLVQAGIPEDQIAIKTANVDELKGVDLLSSQCPIRYIITVNALKEGWDCPFAYILASLANKTSQVDVEQILGRILRQPHTRRHAAELLNMSYVLTSSANFQETVDNVVQGLNAAGFTARDHRVADDLPIEPASEETTDPLPGIDTPQTGNLEVALGADSLGDGEDFLNFDTNEVAARTASSGSEGGGDSEPGTNVAGMTQAATRMGQEYERQARQAQQIGRSQMVPRELEDKVTTYSMNPAYAADVRKLRIPQLFIQTSGSLFADPDDEVNWVLVSKEALGEGFTLRGKDYAIDVSRAEEEMSMVDVRKESADAPKAFGMKARQQQWLREHLASLPEASRITACTDIIVERLDRFDAIASSDVKQYVEQVVGNLDRAQLETLETSPRVVAEKIKEKVEAFLSSYRAEQFRKQIDAGLISARPHFELPERINPPHAITSMGNSLYAGEGQMNDFERRVITKVSALENVTWWHRNIERVGLRLNGAINHYPDFIIRTEAGRIVLLETKGGDRKNEDSRIKIDLGRAWAQLAGPAYRYYMVFEDNVTPLDGAYTVTDFLNVLEKL